MADKKISQLATVSTPLAGTEVLPIVQSGTTKKVTAIELTGTTVDPSGNITIPNGNLVQGTAAKGVNFTANTPAAGMTSQLLNWYEEGTFTPSLQGQASGSATYSVQIGTYTRIGRQVTAKGMMILSASTLSGGYINIAGFPFVASSSVNTHSIGLILVETVTFSGQLTLFMQPSQSIAYVVVANSGASQTTLNGGNFPTGSVINFSLTYFV